MSPRKPGIIVMSPIDADEFQWMSDGWYQFRVRHTTRADKLMAKATEAIESGADVLDVIGRLEEAGFTVRYATAGEIVAFNLEGGRTE